MKQNRLYKSFLFYMLVFVYLSLEINNICSRLLIPSPRKPVTKQVVYRKDGSFSACILIMDENYRLAEWLAFHYHVYNLRYVVVGVDGRSKTSPSAIFDRFRNELGMTIMEWQDADFLNETKFKPLPPDAAAGRIRKRYIYRQLVFLGECVTYMHAAGRTWTALWDPDEFIVFRKESSLFQEQEAPSLAKANVIKDFAINSLSNQQRGDCITIPRVLMGAQREEAASDAELETFDIVDPHQLNTLRWHYHSHEKDVQVNGLTKVMLDVSKIEKHFPISIRNPHRPITAICGSPFFRDNEDAFFRLNHYLGSWEEYSYRDDARKGNERSKEAWSFRAKSCGRRDGSDIADWLRGFVGTIKRSKASLLLVDAGLPKNYTTADRNETDWAVNMNSKVHKNTKSNWRDFVEKQKNQTV